ncbi:hypothetical protein BU15DRAFT_79341 [Melanogaster broomeanus]|nr:hypothetical protein BU15DRAFT_79341 [Melanogaster broomeanus]
MSNGQKFYTGSRDLLCAVPLNTPTEFDISDSETVVYHSHRCKPLSWGRNVSPFLYFDPPLAPTSTLTRFLIEGPRGSVLHTGDLRAEPWFLASITRNPFLQPYLADSADDLRVFVARREGTHAEAAGLIRTLDAIYLDTACLLSPVVVPGKEYAVQGLVELIALFSSNTYFFINSWTWGYEDALKGIARAFHCKIHFDRYKHSIYTHISDPFLRAIGTRDASSTRFHACERFDRCSFVDVPAYDFGVEGVTAPPSKEGKKVVYVNAVTMSCARWDAYKANVKRQVLTGENVNSLLVPLSRHSPLPELMNFVSLFRPHRIIPNTLDPALGCLDWGAMSRMFSGCLSSVSSTPLSSLASITAPPCLLMSHPSIKDLPGPAGLSSKYDLGTIAIKGEYEGIDTAYSNLVGPGESADKWGEKGGKKGKVVVLKAWLGGGRRMSFGRVGGGLGDEEEAQAAAMSQDEPQCVAGPSRLAEPLTSVYPTISSHVKTPRRCANDSASEDSSYDGGSDEHARVAWKLFGVGDREDGCKELALSSPQSQSQLQLDQPAAVEADAGTLPTPATSPILHERRLKDKGKGRELTTDDASRSPVQDLFMTLTTTTVKFSSLPSSPLSRATSCASGCTSPFASFDDLTFSGHSSDVLHEQRTNEGDGSGSQPFACLDNVVLQEGFLRTASRMPRPTPVSGPQPRAHRHHVFVGGRDLPVEIWQPYPT